MAKKLTSAQRRVRKSRRIMIETIITTSNEPKSILKNLTDKELLAKYNKHTGRNIPYKYKYHNIYISKSTIIEKSIKTTNNQKTKKSKYRHNKDKTFKGTWQVRRERLNGMSYAEFLRSDFWKRIQSKARKREYYKTCDACGSTKNIHLHHVSYVRLFDVDAMKDIIPLCATCHSDVHDYAKENKCTVRHATNKVIRKVQDMPYTERILRT